VVSQAELKHARVCMLAFAGYVAVDLGFRVPFAPEVSSLYAHDAAVEKGPMLGMLIPIAAIEILAGARKHTHAAAAAANTCCMPMQRHALRRRLRTRRARRPNDLMKWRRRLLLLCCCCCGCGRDVLCARVRTFARARLPPLTAAWRSRVCCRHPEVLPDIERPRRCAGR